MRWSRRPRLDGKCGVAMAALWVLFAVSCGPSERFNGQPVDAGRPVPELVGVNWDGKRFDLKNLQGRVVVVFFGYTFCPDVCPFTLAKMKQVEAELGKSAEGLDVVFASVDPQRDSVEKLAAYVPSFDRSFYGVRLEPTEIDRASRSFGLTVQYGTPKGGVETDTNYFVDHTGTYFVIDRTGKLRLQFPPTATVDQMVPDLKQLLAARAPERQAREEGRLEIREARAQIFPGRGAVYFEVVNPGATSDRLVRVETSAASAAETHETIDDGGVMRMRPRPEGFEVPAGGTLRLAPGGKHLMLVDPKPIDRASPTEGSTIPLTLHFERAGAIPIQAKVDGASETSGR